MCIVTPVVPERTIIPATTGGVVAVVPTLALLKPQILFLKAEVFAPDAKLIPETTIFVVAVALILEILFIVF